MKKKNGFTLVELLAVIVILAVILIIAMPKISDVIKNSKKASFEATAKTVASQAEKKLMEKEILEDTGSISCNDIVKLNDTDYSSCSITFDGNTAKVSLVGKGKFAGLKVVNATKDSANAIETTGDSSTKTATQYIKELYDDVSKRTENNLKKDNTSDANIRYEGANPNNYVKFNNELWRIIGVFGDNIKLIRSENIGGLSWDSSDENTNRGQGVNEWSRANLKGFLNTMYYGGTDVVCYAGREQEEGLCPTEKLNDTAKSMINFYTWNTGAVDNTKTSDTVAFYNAERGTAIGKDSGDDDIERTTTWQGYVALPYVTDWAYASSTAGCDTNIEQKDSKYNYICKDNNWMHYGTANSDSPWMLSPFAISGEPYNAWNISYMGSVGGEYVYAPRTVFPTVYLNSTVEITGGSGTGSDPYTLK
ncbi:MAG: prepilin-type N-terminal cleavage/methylation domain-containing protein [bacterium]|nr:prepilin-type N-terminal cleavage/methylation domain-containing protein [bacterium]